MNNLQTARNETNNETWRLVGGLEGDIGGSWAWDAYYSHGENKNDQAPVPQRGRSAAALRARCGSRRRAGSCAA